MIEADCKTVIGSRLKQSGMRYARKRVVTAPGANSIIALRCCQLNARFEDYSGRTLPHDANRQAPMGCEKP